MKRAEVDEIQTEEKQKEIIAIKSIQKDYWIYWTLFVFQIKSKLSLCSLLPQGPLSMETGNITLNLTSLEDDMMETIKVTSCL